MPEKIEFFNSQQVAKILNVNVSTIKRWTDEGKLNCTKTAGGHRKFLISHINQFIQNSKIKTSWDNAINLSDPSNEKLNYYLLQKDFNYLADYVVEAATSSQRDNVNRIIRGLYFNQTELFRILDLLLTPALHKIGKLWENGNLSVVEEHIASQIISDSIVQLMDIIPNVINKNKNVFSMVMSSELHDIALKMVKLIMEKRGYNVIFSGQITPSLNMELVFKRFNPERIYISSTYINEKNYAQAEFDKLCFLADKYNVEAVIGGQGFDVLEFKHFKNVKRLSTFEEVLNY